MASHAEDRMELNGDQTAVDIVPQVVIHPSSVEEPQDHPHPHSLSPMPVAGASGLITIESGSAEAMPVLHLHRHEHVEGSVDTEARIVVERLAMQHGQLFAYLHREIEDLK